VNRIIARESEVWGGEGRGGVRASRRGSGNIYFF